MSSPVDTISPIFLVVSADLNPVRPPLHFRLIYSEVESPVPGAKPTRRNLGKLRGMGDKGKSIVVGT